MAVDEARGSSAGGDQPSQRGQGCLRAAPAAFAVLLVAGLGLLAYVSVGVSTVARRAEAHVAVIGRTLDHLPLPPTSGLDTTRSPASRAEATTAVRAQRLGAFAYFFYCGDQCPSWTPDDPVDVVRYGDLARQEGGDIACQKQEQLLGSTAGLHRVPGEKAGSPTARCSFAGCIDSVDIRVDFFGSDQVERFRARGLIGIAVGGEC